MALHNTESYAMSDLMREVKEIVNTYLSNNETFARVQGYIKVANDNLAQVEKQIKRNNLFYEHCSLKSFSFDKSSLLTSSYEIELYFKNQHNEGKFAHFGVDTLIILLAECGLIKDELYYIRGKGFHSGYLSIQDDGTRLWGDYKQLFRKDEIDSLIKSIPNYIIYDVRDESHNTIYANE